MQSKKEQRKAEYAQKQRALHAGVAPTQPSLSPDEVQGHVARHGGRYVGCDKAGRHIGEIGRVTPEWQESNADGNYGFSLGDWWLKVGELAYVAFAARWTANKALLGAGAVGIHEDGWKPEREFSDDDEEFAATQAWAADINANLDRCAQWEGIDLDGNRVGRGGEVTDLWIELLGKDFRGFQVGKFWVAFDHDFGAEKCWSLADVQDSLTEAGAEEIRPVQHALPPSDPEAVPDTKDAP